MTALRVVRAEDRIESDGSAPQSINPSPLVGEWVNTNPASRGLTRVVVRRDGGDLYVRVIGARSGSVFDWGEAKVDSLYAASVQSPNATAFSAYYDFGFIEVRLEANLSLGLLVVASFNTFRDKSPRSNYFSREFFFHAAESVDAVDQEKR